MTHPEGRSRAGSRRLLVGHAVLLAAIALVSTDAVLYTGNTLHGNGRWSSSKLDLDRGTVDAVATQVTRVPLAGNRLDLGAYLGFQELWLDESRQVRELEFAFRVDEPAYLDVLFGPDRKRFAGFRLSLHPDFESLRFEAAADGRFTDSEPLPLRERLEPGSWTRVRASFGPESVELGIDGAPAASFPSPFESVRALGFRGSMQGPLLDDVEVHFDGRAPLVETFANRRGWSFVLGVVALALVALAALGYALLRRVAGMEARRAHLACLATYLVILACVGTFSAVDRLHLSRLEPDDYRAMTAEGYSNRIEAPRKAIQRIVREIGSLPRDRSFRILLVGSSQTWGAGARRRQDTWARVLERALEAPGRRVEVVNAGISGARAEALLELYRRAWHRTDADLVVLDLGHNDEAGPEFARALEGFVGECRWRGIPIVFVLEPSSTEAPTRIGDRHQVMRSVAAGGRVPVVDMHAYLRERRETGHIWWDQLHLTSYGQRLFGEELARELEPYLTRAPRTRRKGPRGS